MQKTHIHMHNDISENDSIILLFFFFLPKEYFGCCGKKSDVMR